ncbi:MAG: DUF4124 domain-containing protein [Burkholderiales bacterium]|jgi:hypothetical protein|nr:DUF4124 domain-containing protein [Burkholderiales bacterium]
MRSVLLLVPLLAALAAPADAQSIFKYVRPDGSVVYSDRPVPGARLDEELERAAPPDPAAAAAARAKQQERANALNERLAERSRSLDQAQSDLREWSRRLDEAKVRLEAGREPLPGERTGVVFQGKSRLNEAYWARQDENEAAVAEAEARVAQARATLQSLR